MAKVTSKMGKIYIGDPCYALNNSDYDKWGEINGFNDGVIEIDEFKFAVYSTEFGDGVYEGSDSFKYPVDSGTIAAIPFELVNKDVENLGRIIETDEIKITCEHGEFHISWDKGDIDINTGYLEDEEENFDDEDLF